MQKKITAYLSVVLLLLISYQSLAQSNPEEEWKMKKYYMVFLTTGPNRTHDSITSGKIMQGHLDNITRLFNEKKLVLAGPFLDDTDLRGIYILDAASEEEAITLVMTDPAIIAGRLSYELHPWYGPSRIILEKGSKEK